MQAAPKPARMIKVCYCSLCTAGSNRKTCNACDGLCVDYRHALLSLRCCLGPDAATACRAPRHRCCFRHCVPIDGKQACLPVRWARACSAAFVNRWAVGWAGCGPRCRHWRAVSQVLLRLDRLETQTRGWQPESAAHVERGKCAERQRTGWPAQAGWHARCGYLAALHAEALPDYCSFHKWQSTPVGLPSSTLPALPAPHPAAGRFGLPEYTMLCLFLTASRNIFAAFDAQRTGRVSLDYSQARADGALHLQQGRSAGGGTVLRPGLLHSFPQRHSSLGYSQGSMTCTLMACPPYRAG